MQLKQYLLQPFRNHMSSCGLISDGSICLIWPLVSVRSNPMRHYFQISNQILKLLIQVILLFLSFSLVKRYICFLLASWRQGETSCMQQVMFSAWGHVYSNTYPAASDINNNGGRREMHIFLLKIHIYFEFVSDEDDIIKGSCTLCAGDKVLSSFKNTASNLMKHLELQHCTFAQAI